MKQPRDLASIEKLLKDKKSGFSLFVRRNNGLKTLGRDFVPGDLAELYDFFLSGKDPEWDRRMATLSSEETGKRLATLDCTCLYEIRNHLPRTKFCTIPCKAQRHS